MDRIAITPRKDWQKTVESQGLYYHTATNPETKEEQLCWDESAHYHFTEKEIDVIEEATYWLNKCCIEAVDYIIENNFFNKVGVAEPYIDWIKNSWEHDEHTIYGRFDLCFDGNDPPKLLEYNADTPTALLEASVIQWYWMKDTQEFYNQFNTIHEKLIEIFKTLLNSWEGRFYFAALAENLEDFMTVNYLRDVAIQAGWKTEYLHVENVGWDNKRNQFVDMEERMIKNCFKLYPWEWMLKEEFGQNLLKNTTNWLEPPWKMLLSNKGILPILYELYPKSDYLLEASFEPLTGKCIKKPLHGREGANMEVLEDGKSVQKTEGPYEGPFIYQRYKELPNFDGNYPVCGSWIINGWAAGLGIREDKTAITHNLSRFVPHIFS